MIMHGCTAVVVSTARIFPTISISLLLSMGLNIEETHEGEYKGRGQMISKKLVQTKGSDVL